MALLTQVMMDPPGGPCVFPAQDVDLVHHLGDRVVRGSSVDG